MMHRYIMPVFWLLVLFIAATVVLFLYPLPFSLSLLPIISTGISGITAILLLLLSVRIRMDRVLRIYLILTGASALAIPVSIVLHNLTTAFLAAWLGDNFWGLGEEPFFFTIAVLLAPLGFVAGIIGSLIFWRKRGLNPAQIID